MGKSARVTIYEAASLLDVSHTQIYKAVNGKFDPANPLKTYLGGKSGKTKLIDVHECAQYLREHAPRLKITAPGLTGDDDDSESNSRWNLREDETIEACLERCLRGGAPKHVIEKLSRAAEAIRRKAESDLKAAAMVSPSDASKMLRSLGDLYVQEIEVGSANFANELLRFLRESFGVDLMDKNVTADQMLESFHRDHSDLVITRIRTEVENQIKGVQELELS